MGTGEIEGVASALGLQGCGILIPCSVCGPACDGPGHTDYSTSCSSGFATSARPSGASARFSTSMRRASTTSPTQSSRNSSSRRCRTRCTGRRWLLRLSLEESEGLSSNARECRRDQRRQRDVAEAMLARLRPPRCHLSGRLLRLPRGRARSAGQQVRYADCS